MRSIFLCLGVMCLLVAGCESNHRMAKLNDCECNDGHKVRTVSDTSEAYGPGYQKAD